MLSVFGDDSSDETQQRTFAVAGVMASEENWQELEARWLARTGGVRFHATDCESDRAQYASNSHLENQTLYKDLTCILAASNACGWGAALDLASYRELFPSVDQEVCYYKAFLAVVNFLANLAHQKLNETVKFTFDSRHQSNHNAGQIYDLLANDSHNTFMCDEISFQCSREQPRIQIADLLTRETMKELDNRIGPVKRTRRKSMQALADTGRFGCDIFLREYFEDMKRQMSELAKADPSFTQEAYRRWLEQFKFNDTTSNRSRFLIWFSRQEKHAARA